MSPLFLSTWIERYEVESSSGYSGEFDNFDAADAKFQEISKGSPADSVRLIAVIAEA